MVIDVIRNFIGLPPVGLEWFEYVVMAITFLILFGFITDIFQGLARILGFK